MHQLQNEDLVKIILTYITALEYEDKGCYGADGTKFNEFIKTKQYDLAEEICRRYYSKDLKGIGYKFTEGKACDYYLNGNVRTEFYLNCNSEIDGSYKQYDEDRKLIIYDMWKNGVCLKDCLNDIEHPQMKSRNYIIDYYQELQNYTLIRNKISEDFIKETEINNNYFKHLQEQLFLKCIEHEEFRDQGNYIKAKEFISNNELDKFNEICRHFYKYLKTIGYQLTPGLACNYDKNGILIQEYQVNDKGQKHGEYKHYNDGKLFIHVRFIDGLAVKNFLN